MACMRSVVVVVLGLVIAVGETSCSTGDDATPPALPPPPLAAKPPIRGAAADTDLRVMLADVAASKACELVRGQFRGLRAPDRPDVVTGFLWIRDCRITSNGADVTFELGTSGWQWAAQTKRKAGGKFTLAQYVRFDAGVTMPGTLDLAYDRRDHVVSMWFTPRRTPDIRFTPTGDFDVDARGAWSSVVGALGSVFASSPEEIAEHEATKQGTSQFEHTLADGLAVTIDLCTGLTRFNLGRRPKGQMQLPDVGETKRVPIELQPTGLAIAGPQLAGRGMTIHAETTQGAARIWLVCAADAETVATAFLAGQPVPATKILGHVDVRGKAKLRIKPAACPVMAVATPLDGAPTTFSWLRLPSEIARSTGGPVIACRADDHS